MTDTTTTSSAPLNVDEISDIVQLRDHAKGLERDLRATRDKLRNVEPAYSKLLFKELGLGDADTDPRTRGILKLHGDGELTAEALRKTAEEHGYTLGDPAGGTGGNGTGQPTQTQTPVQRPTLSPEEQAALDAHQRGAQVMQNGTPASPQTAKARYDEAMAKGDVQAAMKAQAEIQAEFDRAH